MDDLLSDSEKQEIDGAFGLLHTLFGRDVTYYKRPEEVSIQSSDEHNFLFGGAPDNTTYETVTESGKFSARIQWGRKQDVGTLLDTNIILQDGECRIKVDPSGHNVLRNVERIVIDGIICSRLYPARPHGIFTPNYYTYVLKRVD